MNLLTLKAFRMYVWHINAEISTVEAVAAYQKYMEQPIVSSTLGALDGGVAVQAARNFAELPRMNQRKYINPPQLPTEDAPELSTVIVALLSAFRTVLAVHVDASGENPEWAD